MYYEVSTDNELADTIKLVGQAKPISLLVIGGHGTRATTQLGDGNNEESFLDPSDAGQLQGLDVYLKKDSVIILESCSTGEGGKFHINVANMLKDIFKLSKIISPMIPAAIRSYVYGKDSEGNVSVTDVIHSCSEDKKYSIQ